MAVSRDINKAKLLIVQIEMVVADLQYRIANPLPNTGESVIAQQRHELGSKQAQLVAGYTALKRLGVKVD